jgi:hypothetical protein
MTNLRCCLTALLVLLASSSSAYAQWAYVNGASGSNNAGTPLTTFQTSAFSVTGGNHIVCGVEWVKDAGQVVTGVADTASNTYTSVGAAVVTTGNLATELFYAENITGHGSNVITATLDAGAGFTTIACMQHSGVDTSTSLDTSATGTATTGGVVTSGSFDPVDDVMVVAVGCISFAPVNWTPSMGSTIRQTTDFCAAQSECVPSSGSTTRTMTADASTDQGIYVASFEVGTCVSGWKGGLLLIGIR